MHGAQAGFGPVAHLVERSIRIAEVRSSSLLGSTLFFIYVFYAQSVSQYYLNAYKTLSYMDFCRVELFVL